MILCGLGMVKFSFLHNFLLSKYLQNDDEISVFVVYHSKCKKME